MQAGAISIHQELIEQSICLYHCSISSKKDLTTQTHPTVGNRRAGGVLDWGKPWAGGQGTPHGTPAVSTPRGGESGCVSGQARGAQMKPLSNT